MPRPDAVFIHESLKQGETAKQRGLTVLDIAESLLQVDKAAGEHAFVRCNPYRGFLFVSRSGADRILYPYGHPNQLQPKHRWADAEGYEGKVRVGTLIEKSPETEDSDA